MQHNTTNNTDNKELSIKAINWFYSLDEQTQYNHAHKLGIDIIPCVSDREIVKIYLAEKPVPPLPVEDTNVLDNLLEGITQGEWKLQECYKDSWRLVGQQSDGVKIICWELRDGYQQGKESKANAALLLIAPVLYKDNKELKEENKRLKDALQWIEMKSFHKNEWTEMEAINAKAKEALQQ